MSKFLSFRDGGQTDEHGIARPYGQFLSGNVFDGLQVTQQSPLALGVSVSAGDIMIDSGNGYPYVGWSDAVENVTLNTADGSNPRYDLIVAYIDLSVVSDAAPNNPGALLFTDVTGTPAGSPSEPSAGTIQTAVGGSNPYAILARVLVAAGATTISNSAITDRRTMITSNLASANGGWEPSPDTFTYGANNGNKEFTVTVPGDVTTRYSNGMKVKFTRGTTAPTQSTDLEYSSSQYWSKTSPAGMTFTDDFVVSAWVKLESYAVANIQGVVTRYNGTSGWLLYISTTGQIVLQGLNAGAGNRRDVTSHQSIPLGRWVHIAAQLDMSAHTATTTTSYVMIDGVDVPAFVNQAGTNPTSLIQAGNLEIGAYNGGAATTFFDGKIAQVAIFSAKVTQATIRSYMHQNMVGNETSVISYYKFDGNGNDLNANANNLTAQAGATATNADNPFKDTEYAIVTNVAYSSPTTTITLFTGTDHQIPNMTLNSPYYSSQRTPYGFPASENKWTVQSLYRDQVTVQSTPTASTWYNPNNRYALLVPAGAWEVEAAIPLYISRTSGSTAMRATISDTGGNSENDLLYTEAGESSPGSDNTFPLNPTRPVDQNSNATYYLNSMTPAGGVSSIIVVASRARCFLKAKCAYV